MRVHTLGTALLLLACTRQSAPGAGGTAPPGDPPAATGGAAATLGTSTLDDPAAFGPVGVTRLSRAEYRRTLVDLLGVDGFSTLERLPEDVLVPFDNQYQTQVASLALVSAIAGIADEATKLALASDSAKARLVTCQPSGPSDSACLRTFIEAFGRRALRRPLEPSEVSELLNLQAFAVQEGDFFSAVGLVMQVLLQDLEFVYRIQLGTPLNDRVVQLTSYELAARLAYLLTGGPPSASLLDAAAAGALDTAGGVRQVVSGLFAEPLVAERVARFHALWLGFDTVDAGPELNTAFKAETRALVERYLFQEHRPWTELFSADQAFVDQNLAGLYGLPPPATPSWTAQTDPNRRGLLGQAAFLASGAKFGDTSPTLRGIIVRERLLCQPIPDPPPTVNADVPPAGSPDQCKADRYQMHAENPCATCHFLIDPIGRGLEAYDALGKFRTHELDVRPGASSEFRADCPIDGQGELQDLGAVFTGPAGLSRALVDSGRLEPCVMENLFQFVTGHRSGPESQLTVASMTEKFATAAFDFPNLLLDVVTSAAFRHRVTEEPLP